MKVFICFCNLRIFCGAKRHPSLTNKRKLIISDAIQIFGTNEIIRVMNYIRCSDDNYCKFMRKNGYTDIINILNEFKWSDKLNRANEFHSCYINKERKAV
tara:strand:+ start:247 stop:546 length:300 start_codon:yes stop_codon:yes gene_type:complete